MYMDIIPMHMEDLQELDSCRKDLTPMQSLSNNVNDCTKLPPFD